MVLYLQQVINILVGIKLESLSDNSGLSSDLLSSDELFLVFSMHASVSYELGSTMGRRNQHFPFLDSLTIILQQQVPHLHFSNLSNRKCFSTLLPYALNDFTWLQAKIDENGLAFHITLSFKHVLSTKFSEILPTFQCLHVCTFGILSFFVFCREAIVVKSYSVLLMKSSSFNKFLV